VFTFPVGPFPVTVDLSFLLVAVLLGWQRPIPELLGWILVVFVSVLVHELGHAVYARSLGARPRILLRGFGGLTMAPLPRQLTWVESLSLALAGPAAGLLPAVVAAVLVAATNPAVGALVHEPGLLLRMLLLRLDGRTPFEELLLLFARTGPVWTVLNLLPILPLDGGSVLQALLTAVRRRNSLRQAAYFSAVLAGLVALAGFFLLGWGGIFLELFMVGFALQNVALLRQMGRQQAVAATPDPRASAEARAVLEAARAAMGDGNEPLALDLAAQLEQRGGQVRGATAARIRAGVLLARGELGPAGLEAGRSYAMAPEPDAAVVAARAALRQGDPAAARTWLKRAMEAGASAEQIQRDRELGPLVAPAAAT
jgi:stage IV sporulation protein FB